MNNSQLKAWLAELKPQEKKWLEEIQFLADSIQTHYVLELIYKSLDLITQRLQKLLPEIPCPSGCSDCCQRGEPDAFPQEFELIQNMYPEVKPAVQAGTDATTTACGFLLEGQCQIYAARPLSCRLMGYSFYQPQEQVLPMFAPPPAPWTCAPEKTRIQAALNQVTNPIRYMYLPLLNQYLKHLQTIEPGAQRQPLSAYF